MRRIQIPYWYVHINECYSCCSLSLVSVYYRNIHIKYCIHATHTHSLSIRLSQLEGSDLLGGADDDDDGSMISYIPLEEEEDGGEYDHDRRASSTSCSSDKGSVMVVLKTDKYGYETSWKILDGPGYAVAKGPPSNTRYNDNANYSGKWCLPSGTYKVVVSDKSGDGMCPGNPDIYGCGFFKVYLNGEPAGQIVSVKSAWSSRAFTINVAPVSSRIDGTTTSSSGGSDNNDQWCTKVKSVMKVPQGTCTLSNGSRGHRVRVTTKVDKYGEETSWKIARSNGSVVMKMGAIVPSNSVKAVEDCLPPGDYNLSFSDLDGICCKHGQGYYNLIVDGQQILEGGAFISSVNHDFKLGYDWISDMSERDCEWWWAHDYRRRDWHTRCYNGQYCNKSYRHMRWSATLKADAQDYAQRLLSTCDGEGIHHDASDYGENLAKNKGSGVWGQLYPADRITKRFVDNEEFWGWNANAHLTQSMWYATRYIGCGESVKTMSNGEICRFQVCRYSKPGNCVMGSYNAGQGNNWMKPMMADDSPCKPFCPSTGCHL